MLIEGMFGFECFSVDEMGIKGPMGGFLVSLNL